jgi:hypothetical protein
MQRLRIGRMGALLGVAAMALSACGGGGTTTSTTPPVTPPPSAATGSVALSASTYAVVVLSTSSMTISVNRSGGSSGSASVQYATANGTAVAGMNYTTASGTLSWADGDATAKSFNVSIATTAFSGTKTFTVTLSNASGSSMGTPTTATVTINGATAAPLTGTLALAAASNSVAQAAGTVAITVFRTGGSSGAASVNYATANGTAVAGSNYTAASGMLSWASGDTASKNFTVPLSATPFAGTKTFNVTLTNASGAKLGSPVSAQVTINGTTGSGAGSAALLAAKLGLPSRLLVGLGSQAVVATQTAIQNQGLHADIYDQYLAGPWTTYNSPPCDFACVIYQQADSVSAVPMYTVYQMALNGENNLTVLTDSAFMAAYWANLKTLYQDLATYGKPALVNLEPDFWGYVQLSNNDPSKTAALVNTNPDCASQPNTITGVVGCMISMARRYAPKTYVGFPISTWGAGSIAQVVTFMSQMGAGSADMIVEETLDRDAGCFEVTPLPTGCARGGTGYYWDETNQTHPNFQDHLAEAAAFHAGLNNLPIIWWQTPEGVPSSTPGGTPNHYRDNRVHYFLTHPAELTAVGGLGVVFSNGDGQETSVSTDGGQFKTLSTAYLAAPSPLP